MFIVTVSTTFISTDSLSCKMILMSHLLISCLARAETEKLVELPGSAEGFDCGFERNLDGNDG